MKPEIHLDFETYSEAGTIFNLETGRFSAPPGVAKRGIGLTGAYAYAAHPSADILCASYTLDHGKNIFTWRPGLNPYMEVEPPRILSDAVIDGSLVYAFNSFFEWCVWNLVAVRRYGWPALPLSQTRDVAAAALAWSLPGSLEMSSAALFGETRKDTDGKRIMLKFSQPRNPTKNDKRLKFAPDYFKTASEAEDWHKLYEYCEQDVRAEIAVHDATPELSPFELEVWKLDQKINARGVAVDLETVRGCIKIVEEGRRRAGLRLAELTNGAVDAVSKATALLNWVNGKVNVLSARLLDLRPENIKKFLADNQPIPPEIIKALELRLAFGGNAVSKLYAMLYRSEPDGRVRGAFQYCGAQRTRRWAGRGLQTQNMPRGDVELWKCGFCGELTKPETKTCTRCRATDFKKQEWGIESVEAVLPAVQSGEYDTVNILWGNPNKIVSGCLRSMLTAAPDHELISSDYSAIEAVVMACLAGESWIIETFFGDGKLYERTAAKITGETPETIIGYKNEHGKHHPARRLGKVASLASQYQGARGAWLAFGADKFLSVSEIDEGVRAWRENCAAIVNFWGRCENAAKSAVIYPDREFSVFYGQRVGTHTNISFQKQGRALYCILPNGEWLTYLDAKIVQKRKMSSEGWRILEAWENMEHDPAASLELEHVCQSHPNLLIQLKNIDDVSQARKIISDYCFQLADTLVYNGVGVTYKWTEIETYGGKLAENIVQAVSRFILAEAMLRIEAVGYPIVLHTHDEIVSEVPADFGSVEEFERIISIMPEWAKLPDGRYWPIKAAGGWRGKRYRK